MKFRIREKKYSFEVPRFYPEIKTFLFWKNLILYDEVFTKSIFAPETSKEYFLSYAEACEYIKTYKDYLEKTECYEKLHPWSGVNG
jgi:hypothetical protein